MAAQVVHEVAAAAEYVPAEQDVQLVAPAALYVPAEQLAHKVPDKYVPAEHDDAHELAPADDVVPVAHAVHDDEPAVE